MRDRKEILKDINVIGDETPYKQIALWLTRLFLEVLLDIRDLLKNEKGE